MATQADQIVQAIIGTFGTVEAFQEYLQLSQVITQISVEVFESKPEVYRESLEAIKKNTDEVTRQNRIAEIRKEIQTFTQQKEDEIQALLGMK
jgi:hypothetical protein